MAKDVIQIHGEDRVVREDVAKSYRGRNWALISMIAFVVIAAVLFLSFLWSATRDGSLEAPSSTGTSAPQR